MGEDDNLALEAHTKKEKFKKEDHSHKKPKKYHKSHSSQKDHSTFKCYSCKKLELNARNCPHAKDQVMKERKRGIMLMPQKTIIHVQKKARDDCLSEKEYVLIFCLIGTITHGSDTWLVDNGASKNMIGLKDSLTNLTEKDSPHKVQLGD